MAQGTKKPKRVPVPEAPPERVPRIVSLPIKEIIGADGPAVLDTFAAAWRLSTDLANWCQRALALNDPGLRTPDAERLTKYDPKCLPGGRSLYQHVVAACPFHGAFAGASDAIAIITKTVEDTWRGHPDFGRLAVLWRGEARPAVFRHPYPWPLRGDSVRLFRDPAGRPCARLVMPGGRVSVRLADGAEFARQLRQYDRLLADPARLKQSRVTGRSKGGRLVGADLRLVGLFDAAEPRAGGVAAVIRTDPAALLVVEADGRRPWILNHDEARRLQAAHRAFRQRIAEDLKHEKRLTRDQRAGLRGALERRCEKHARRMDTLLHQVSAQVAGYCRRAEVAAAVYDDGVKSYQPDGFPWAALADRIRYKLADAGVQLVGKGELSLPGTEDEKWQTVKSLLKALAGWQAAASRGPSKSHPAVSVPPTTQRTSRRRSSAT